MTDHDVTLETIRRLPDWQADRAAIVLALAILAIDRPGWHEMLRGIAEKHFNQAAAFNDFHRLNADRFQPGGDRYGRPGHQL